MNLELLIPVFSSILGRDLSREYDLFKRFGVALNDSMDDESRDFFRRKWPTVVDFAESPEGQDALKVFSELWAEWDIKKELGALRKKSQAKRRPEPQEQESGNAGAEDNQSE